MRTLVTFKSAAFNTTEPREYFINPGCFGDDLARWLIRELRARGAQAEEEPGQEDFGWYLNFTVNGRPYCLVLAYRPGDGADEGDWVGWLERDCGLIAAMFGGRRRGILPEAAEVIHAVLSSSPEIREIRWHTQEDSNIGHEERGSSDP
jgi:hypothetical protein